MSDPTPLLPLTSGESKDGTGHADHDEPYEWGRRPTTAAPFPFSHLQLSRLLRLRSLKLDQPDIDDAASAAPKPPGDNVTPACEIGQATGNPYCGRADGNNSGNGQVQDAFLDW